MRKLSYYTCLTIFGVTNVLTGLAWVVFLLKLPISTPPIIHTLKMFGSLIPIMFSSSLPKLVHITVLLISLYLVFRRLWLMKKHKEYIPNSFRGFPKVISIVGCISFLLGVVMIVIGIIVKAGSGVPAGLVLIPAAYCIPWGFFLTEVLIFRSSPSSPR